MLLYGALVEAERLVVVRRRLRLPHWPNEKSGYKIALLADFHLRDEHTVDLAKRAVSAALAEQPDVVVIAGDFVGYWKPESPWLISEALSALGSVPVLAVPGNHDYWAGNPDLLEPVCEELGIKLLRNRSHAVDGINWIGIDSFNAEAADPCEAFCSWLDLQEASEVHQPTIVLWHEPDPVDILPDGIDLMLSGHTHGGQFLFPGDFAPMTTKNGRRYRRGFYPEAPTPLYVTSGIGTTGPPSRFLCPPEVVILTLEPADGERTAIL